MELNNGKDLIPDSRPVDDNRAPIVPVLPDNETEFAPVLVTDVVPVLLDNDEDDRTPNCSDLTTMSVLVYTFAYAII